jgi:hypothetical protein
MSHTIFEVISAWSLAMSIEIGIVVFFVWVARDKPQSPSS